MTNLLKPCHHWVVIDTIGPVSRECCEHCQVYRKVRWESVPLESAARYVMYFTMNPLHVLNGEPECRHVEEETHGNLCTCLSNG